MHLSEVYRPLIPEAVVSMLACARLGTIHSVVFGGFSADSFHARIDDVEARLVITADGGYRKGKVFPLKPTVDESLADAPISAMMAFSRHAGTGGNGEGDERARGRRLGMFSP